LVSLPQTRRLEQVVCPQVVVAVGLGIVEPLAHLEEKVALV
jgi:hypothetical protein